MKIISEGLRKIISLFVPV